MFRFQASKFKNADAKVPKREFWITDISVGSPQSCGNHIAASTTYVAFVTDQRSGGNLAVLDLNFQGRVSPQTPQLCAHSSLVTDFGFSPFDPALLATGSSDESVKIWRIPDGGLAAPGPGPPPLATCTLLQPSKVDLVAFHPAAEGVLGVACGRAVTVWDLEGQRPALGVAGLGEQVTGLSWKEDGSLLASTGRDRTLRVHDPRAPQTPCQQVSSHQNVKDSRVCWLGNSDQLVSTGFSRMSEREVFLWDLREPGRPLKTISMGSATSILMPFFDADTDMLFLAGKADTNIKAYHLSQQNPFLAEGSTYFGELQQKGVAMVPKRALDVMSCEVNRLMQLTPAAVVPVSYRVPRKSYQEFYPELFPDTLGGQPAMTCSQWLEGGNAQVARVSLDPNSAAADPNPAKASRPEVKSSEVSGVEGGGQRVEEQQEEAGPAAADQHSQPAPDGGQLLAPSTEGVRRSPSSSFKQGPSSKFRHLVGQVLHPSTHLYNLRNLAVSIFGECDGFHANRRLAALPLSLSGGHLAVLRLDTPGKLEDVGLPAVENGSPVMDFRWDPFHDGRLAVGCDDAKIRVWHLPAEGLAPGTTLTQPALTLPGHSEKIYSLLFHPLASLLLASSSFDMTVKLWDLDCQQDLLTLRGHTDQIFGMAWHPDGTELATFSKDGLIRIYRPRQSLDPIQEGRGPVGARGGRLLYVLEGRRLVVSGFDRQSHRLLSLYDPRDLQQAVATVTTDVSPATLILHYDADTSVLFCSGKGDTTVFGYEVSESEPYFQELAAFSSSTPHQALSFLPKDVCRVEQVEFARAIRLSRTTLEPIAFKVPRVKTEYFQDDIFPDTKVRWEATMTAEEWFKGQDHGEQKTISLKPAGMTNLSEAPKEVNRGSKYDSYKELDEYKTDEQKKEELLKAMEGKLGARDGPLPQDQMEGVDDDEWDD